MDVCGYRESEGLIRLKTTTKGPNALWCVLRGVVWGGAAWVAANMHASARLAWVNVEILGFAWVLFPDWH